MLMKRFRGFDVCRAIATQFPTRCLAVHTANPVFVAPRGVLAKTKYRIAKMTGGRFEKLGFGYTPQELQPRSSASEVDSHSHTLHRLYSLRPQTLSFSLCDSPVGLLAALLDIVHTKGPDWEAVTSRSRSPFLSPVELEMRDVERGGMEMIEEEMMDMGEEEGVKDKERSGYMWTPTEMLSWTMMQWLPGKFIFLGMKELYTFWLS